MRDRRGVAAAAVALGAFLLYYTTLLPGLDFGDTGSFQTMAGSPYITPRDGYPLYFAIGRLMVWWNAAADPARTLNLASAIQGAVACGIAALVAAELSGSVLAGTAAAAMFAASYTFWSQSIIAEVYALHCGLLMLAFLLLLRWQRQPSLGRLAAFFAVYALGFGNHLSMILVFPACAAFIVVVAQGRDRAGLHPSGWRWLLSWPVVLAATLLAGAGALQYAWNLRTLWLLPQPPTSLFDALSRFWFDVTKSDWRDTMILHVPSAVLRDRAAAYWFDVSQQFGPFAFAASLLGLGALALADWRRALLVGVAYLGTVTFAFTYNVGDTHVFYLPSHLMLALLFAPAIASLGSRVGHVPLLAAVVLGYATLRVVNDYPALDRSADRRPSEVLAALTSGLDDQRTILLTDLNWQVENGLSYFGAAGRASFAHARMPSVLLYAPTLIRDNIDVGRTVALTARARDDLAAAYGPLFPTALDRAVVAPSLDEVARQVPAGTRFVLTLLKPTRDDQLDREEVRRALVALTGEPAAQVPDGDFAAVAGLAGHPPSATIAENSPFRRTARLDGADVQIRMESWLAFDTIRRMGFGHVIVNRRHTLIVERGASLVTFDATGRAETTVYAGNVYEPQRRFIVAER
jgi:hypothetical protein